MHDRDVTTSEPALQPQLDEITTRTRELVQPERLLVVERAVAELLASGAEQRVVRAGALLPHFTLPEATTNHAVRSEDLLALGPLVVTFFRGRWDPYCMTQLEVWQRVLPAVRARGALLVAVSPQLPRQNDFTAQQHGLTFPMLSDAGNRVAALFGLTWPVPEYLRAHYRSVLVNIPYTNGDESWQLPLPGTFLLTGEPGGARVAWAEAFADHRSRPEPGDLLAALDALRTTPAGRL